MVSEMGLKVVTPLLLLLFLKVSLAEDTNWFNGLEDFENTGGSGIYEDDEKSGEGEGGHGEEGHVEAHEKAGEEEEDEEQLKEAKKREEMAKRFIAEVEKSEEERGSKRGKGKQTSPDEGRNNPLAFVEKLRRMRWKSAWNVPMTNLYPTGLRLGQFSSTWANLFWDAPPLPEHIIVANYSVLCFQPEFEHYLPSVPTDGPETTVRLEHLEMGTMYQCDVRVTSFILQLDLVGFFMSTTGRDERGSQRLVCAS